MAGDTGAMAPKTPRERLTRKDWTGDAMLTVVGGAVCLVAVFLPWANVEGPGVMSYGLTHPDSVRGVLQTQWGPPALGLALAVLLLGVLMLALGPGRAGVALGLLTAAAGVAIVLVGRGGASAVVRLDDPGGAGLGRHPVRGRPAGAHRPLVGRRRRRPALLRPRAARPASSRNRSTELTRMPSTSAMRNLADIALGSPGCRFEWSRILPRPFSPLSCSMA